MIRMLSPRRNRAALRRLLRRLGANRRGVAAVEFAFVLPVMLLIYFGIVEVGQGVMIERKVTGLARTVGDLTSQTRSASVTDAEMSGIFDAASTLVMPFEGAKTGMVISSIVIDAAGKAEVCWSNQRNSTALSKGAISLPDSVRIPNSSVIMATASYEFEPVIGYAITGKIKIAGGPFYMRPRTGKAGGKLGIEQIERTGVDMCPKS